MGYEVAIGEIVRSVEQARANAALGKGISSSLHIKGLAGDLNLYRNGRYLADSRDHAPLGLWWKEQHPDCRWGGDFTKPDGNHYSMTDDGVHA